LEPFESLKNFRETSEGEYDKSSLLYEKKCSLKIYLALATTVYLYLIIGRIPSKDPFATGTVLRSSYRCYEINVKYPCSLMLACSSPSQKQTAESEWRSRAERHHSTNTPHKIKDSVAKARINSELDQKLHVT
jgi:hypothetical protein